MTGEPLECSLTSPFGGDGFDDLDATSARRAIRCADGHPGIAFTTFWNEADSALTRDSARRLVAANDAPQLNVTISLSAGASGDPDTVIDGIARSVTRRLRGAPHWPRVDGWWERAVPYSIELQSATDLRAGPKERRGRVTRAPTTGPSRRTSVERGRAAGYRFTQHTESGWPWLGSLAGTARQRDAGGA